MLGYLGLFGLSCSQPCTPLSGRSERLGKGLSTGQAGFEVPLLRKDGRADGSPGRRTLFLPLGQIPLILTLMIQLPTQVCNNEAGTVQIDGKVRLAPFAFADTLLLCDIPPDYLNA